MAENESFDFDDIVEELANRVEGMIEEKIADQVEDAVSAALQDILPDMLSECFADFGFVLKDGTIVKPKQRMKLFSPDKSKLLLCYGGLRVDGSTLFVQKGINSWESIASYQTREEAIEALDKVKRAMDANLAVFEL